MDTIYRTDDGLVYSPGERMTPAVFDAFASRFKDVKPTGNLTLGQPTNYVDLRHPRDLRSWVAVALSAAALGCGVPAVTEGGIMAVATFPTAVAKPRTKESTLEELEVHGAEVAYADGLAALKVAAKAFVADLLIEWKRLLADPSIAGETPLGEESPPFEATG